MDLTVARTGLLALSLSGVAAGGWLIFRDRLGPVPAPAMAFAATTVNRDSLPNFDSLAALIVARNVLSPTRSPGPGSEATTVSEVSAPAGAPGRPVLRLTGVLWSASPTAVIEGFPGHTGARILSPGDSIGGYRVLEILSDRVRVAGMDTTWVLQLNRRDQP